MFSENSMKVQVRQNRSFGYREICNMKRIFMLVILAFCTACSTDLPRYERHIDEFILQTAEERMNLFSQTSQRLFPQQCEWFDLDHVVDGDTLVLTDGTKVRFLGVDTPEVVHPEKPVQFCGPEASSWTKNVFNFEEKVCLVFDSQSDEWDMYGRRLAYPFSFTGVDVTVELLKQGLAKGYFGFPFSRADEFRAYHDWAKEQQKGVWSKKTDSPECILTE